MQNGNGKDAVVGLSAVGLGLLGLGVIGIAGSPKASAAPPSTTPEEPSEETETQTYTPPDGTKEIKIEFPEGTRYVEKMELDLTPTLEDGVPVPGLTGTLYLIVKEHGKLPELHKFPDGSTGRIVQKDVHYEFDIPFNKWLDVIIVRIRVAGATTKMNDIVVVLTKR